MIRALLRRLRRRRERAMMRHTSFAMQAIRQSRNAWERADAIARHAPPGFRVMVASEQQKDVLMQRLAAHGRADVMVSLCPNFEPSPRSPRTPKSTVDPSAVNVPAPFRMARGASD